MAFPVPLRRIQTTSVKTRLLTSFLGALVIALAIDSICHPYPQPVVFYSPPQNEEANTGGSFKMAFDESLGFFDDVPESDWIRQKEISKQKVHVGPIEDLVLARHIYQNVWESDFSCRHDVMVGPMRDGHKWVCDPHRLERIHNERKKETDEGCLIYSIGCNGIFTF